jgi:undecaprenyl-diphosphatase
VPIVHAIALGITQGLSEFLPISSSGHLLLVPWLFGWHDFGADVHLEKTFDVALHLGTLVGAIAYFRADIVRLLRAGFTAPRTDDGRLAWMIVVASIPAALAGATFADTIEEKTGKIWLIATMLIVFAVLLGIADRRKGARTLADFRLRDALVMGGAQVLALQPGTSRSGATITGGLFLGLTRDAAARFAFLMSLPITAGAVVFKGVDVASSGGLPDGFIAPFAWGILASAITGYAAVWATLRLVRTHSFMPFVIYRIVAGVGVLIVLATTFR